MESNSHVATAPPRVEVVSENTAGAILPIQAQRITELKSEVATLKSSRFALSIGCIAIGGIIGFFFTTLLMPPRERVVQVEKPMVIEKPVTVDRYCLIGCR